jgi:hypothetical protein
MVASSKPTKVKEEWHFNMVTTVQGREELTNWRKDSTQRY